MSRLPQIKAADLVKFLKSQGFKEERQSGSHVTLFHEERGTVTDSIASRRTANDK
jgi:predicted RNA binding protein YcfA (HicA-like mRNA interferase family)